MKKVNLYALTAALLLAAGFMGEIKSNGGFRVEKYEFKVINRRNSTIWFAEYQKKGSGKAIKRKGPYKLKAGKTSATYEVSPLKFGYVTNWIVWKKGSNFPDKYKHKKFRDKNWKQKFLTTGTGKPDSQCVRKIKVYDDSSMIKYGDPGCGERARPKKRKRARPKKRSWDPRSGL